MDKFTATTTNTTITATPIEVKEEEAIDPAVDVWYSSHRYNHSMEISNISVPVLMDLSPNKCMYAPAFLSTASLPPPLALSSPHTTRRVVPK